MKNTLQKQGKKAEISRLASSPVKILDNQVVNFIASWDLEKIRDKEI